MNQAPTNTNTNANMGKYFSRKQTRLKGFDYSSENLYFVTICTHEMHCIFGKIVDRVGTGSKGSMNFLTTFESNCRVSRNCCAPTNMDKEFPDLIITDSPGEMVLSPLGEVVKTVWEELSQHFPITLYNFQIMPNHIHGLIQIEGEIGEACRKYFERINHETFDANLVSAVEELSVQSVPVGAAFTTPSIREENEGLMNQAPTGSVNTEQKIKVTLGEIVRSFKAKASKQIHESGLCDSPIWQRNYHDHIVRDDDDYSRIAGYIIFNPKVWDRDRNNPRKYRA